MNKKYKIVLGLGGLTATLAPIATLVSCGGSTESKNSIIGTLGVNGGSSTDINKGVLGNISALTNKSLADVTATKYSVDKLIAEAQDISGEKDIRWTNGVLEHSAMSTASFVKQMAQLYGFDEKNYWEKVHFNGEDGSMGGYAVIDDSFVNPITDHNDPKWIVNEVYSKIKQKPLSEDYASTIEANDTNSEIWQSLAEIDNSRYKLNLDQVGYSGQTGNSAKFTIDGKDLTLITKGSAAHVFRFNHIDPNEPGTNIFKIVDTKNKIVRIIRQKNMMQKYPVIENAKFEKDFLPTLETTIFGFMNLLDKNQQDANEYVSHETLSGVKFLMDKLFEEKNGKTVFKTGAYTEFVNNLKKLNNGSVHWLAIKAFFNGFDSSFFSGFYNPFNNTTTSFNLIQNEAGLGNLQSIKSLLDYSVLRSTLEKVDNWASFLLGWKPSSNLEKGYSMMTMTLNDTTKAIVKPVLDAEFSNVDAVLSNLESKFNTFKPRLEAILSSSGGKYEMFRKAFAGQNIGNRRLGFYAATEAEMIVKNGMLQSDIESIKYIQDCSKTLIEIIQTLKPTAI